MADTQAEIGVIGGSGLYELLTDAREVPVETPYGAPSEPLTIGEVAGRTVAFLPRHGRDHRFPPHRIPHRANLWALRGVGVRQVLAPCAVGSLRPDLGPGTLVVPDQLVDRTSRHHSTYFDTGGAVHVGFADPYCPAGRRVALDRARAAGWSPVDGGALVVIEGPRFSTRAESRWYAAQGWSLVGMTSLPEAALARELALCYTGLALVTDLDAGVETGEGVTHAEVLDALARELPRLSELVIDIVAALPATRDCDCPQALEGIRLPFPLP